uniref:Uncharacterized protein n=1 Tax=Myoviridae sp. ct5Tq8 TaxID=2826612 RepID=A0A8S5NCU9_9CAUD|nr:MAG TPA: hypothetical protein [Myoviridae sp. ct5Tq8]
MTEIVVKLQYQEQRHGPVQRERGGAERTKK